MLDTSANESATPRCAYFGRCGGCQLQQLAYVQQVERKREALLRAFAGAGIALDLPIALHTAEPWGYRNRIRLRVLRHSDRYALGYNANAGDPLPVTECPIAAPMLWRVAEAVLQSAAETAVAAWLSAASELELFMNHDGTQVQVTLLCAPRTRLSQASFEAALQAWQQHTPAGIRMVGAGAIAADVRTGPTGRVLASAGAAGLSYRVGDESFWISRGGFFQVNQFLLDAFAALVADKTQTLAGAALAWDLFAGVGLFTRSLTRLFAQVIAVEASPVSSADNRTWLAKQNAMRAKQRSVGAHTAMHASVTATTLEFLARAVLERERPELVVLDPPRAGAGEDACRLLLKIAPQRIVYVSCDPTTLARDLAVLCQGYRVDSVDLFDLFPQTSHVETVVVLERQP
jgi:23S rRNA (uracil1939-C5)-methyltransferase